MCVRERGTDAQAEVTIEVQHQGQMYRGRAVSTDSIEASAKAFLVAINRIASVPQAAERLLPTAPLPV